MKLTLKQIQALDCLLQEFLYRNEIKHKMQLVIKVNSELFTGKFIDYKESKISYMYLNKSKYFRNKSIDSVEFINFYEPLNSWNNFYFDEILEKYKNLLIKNDKYLLKYLIDLINNIDISNINLDPILLNPKKINNFSESYPLEYMYLDESITYDVVSIIKINN
ncbi:hypothetical protein [uncultured Clostridium sp.]|uniref:hypothetical protein n=1 Tax=uncultured Clostridium sp. TaxID=59620 RepID=UPI0026740904|nr:hypothetical protein [uncultured Clostridium sp.]